MNINIYTKNFDLKDVEEEYIKEKIQKIKKYSLIEDRQVVDVKIEKNTHHEKGEDSYIMSIDLNVKSKLIYIEKSSNNVFTVTDMCDEVLVSEITQYKEILNSKKRK